MHTKLVVIRIRGDLGVRKPVVDTMKMLRLYNKNYAVILDSTPSIVNMLINAKDYITWGELDKEALHLLLEKRARLPGNKQVTDSYVKEKLKISLKEFSDKIFENKAKLSDLPGMRLFFRLKPPVKGFEKGGIKKPFAQGGVLGYRTNKVNDLLKRML
ncbi:50S ribosomal protein L30 [Candidatus Woesearchaeota archaeon]|nr:50S ribosomal protein L30 [Candidatus Woesearchaeota archaeon]